MYEARRQRSSWARIKLSIVRKVMSISYHFVARCSTFCCPFILCRINKLLFRLFFTLALNLWLLLSFLPFGFCEWFAFCFCQRGHYSFVKVQLLFIIIFCKRLKYYNLPSAAIYWLRLQRLFNLITHSISSILKINIIDLIIYILLHCKMSFKI